MYCKVQGGAMVSVCLFLDTPTRILGLDLLRHFKQECEVLSEND